MRIACPAAEYPDVPVERGRVRIGSAEDNGLVLEPESGILPSHMQIEVEARRGIVLTALSEAATIFVNGRPVREKALLRVGDLVVAGQVRMVLKADDDPVAAPDSVLGGTPAEEMGPTLPLLRGHTGTYVGHGLPLGSRTTIGADPACTITIDEPQGAPRLLQIEARGGRLALRVLAEGQQVEVNGVPVRSASRPPIQNHPGG